MRVITGIYRGRKIEAPQNTPVRPTTDFAKTGLFNVLENRIPQAWELIQVLDLFAGFGAISLEFMSRGVKNLILNDIELKNINVIKKNFERIGVPNVQYSKEDALQLLKNLSRQHSFDVIFADPPYEYLHYSDLIDQIFAGNILKANGYFILEHDDQKKFDHHPNLIEHRKYGKVHFSFFQHLIP